MREGRVLKEGAARRGATATWAGLCEAGGRWEAGGGRTRWGATVTWAGLCEAGGRWEAGGGRTRWGGHCETSKRGCEARACGGPRSGGR